MSQKEIQELLENARRSLAAAEVFDTARPQRLRGFTHVLRNVLCGSGSAPDA